MAKLVYPGRPGAYSEIAATALGAELGVEVTSAGPTFLHAFDAVTAGAAEFAALPLRNSRAGWVVPTLELLSEPDVTPALLGTLELPIHHALLVARGGSGDVEEVWSHPQALAQCAARIRAQGWRTKEFDSTALAAEEVARTAPAHVAAIAHVRCSQLLPLEVQETGIQDDDDNATTFGLFRRRTAGDAERLDGRPQLLRLENAASTSVRAIFAAAKVAESDVAVIPNAAAVTTFVVVTENDWAVRVLAEAGGHAVGAFAPFLAASSSARS